jgi:WD40 repeat protein
LWSLQEREAIAELSVAGTPALVAVDPTGQRVAVADYDRAVRVWDFASGDLLAQIDLPVQPSQIQLAPGGGVLGIVGGRSGMSVWDVARPQTPLVEEFADGDWRIVFSSSGSKVLAGRAETGYQVYSAIDGRIAGPPVAFAVGSGAMLAFTEDENLIFSARSPGMSRFWRAPDIPALSESEQASGRHSLQRPSADRVVVGLPGARGIAIGDSLGQVHFLAAGSGSTQTSPMADDLTFIGHTAEVVQLEVAADGSLVASAAADDSIRVWESGTGTPRPWMARLEGNPVSDLELSPDSNLLAVLRGGMLTLLDAANGSVAAEFELGEVFTSQAFVADDRLLIGSVSGSLRLVSKDPDGTWSLQELWRGQRPIRQLAHAPRANYLVVVDDVGHASLLILDEGHIGEQVLEFPGPVEEVAFGASTSRALFRTARWVHRVSVSGNGLHWIDSVLAPKPLPGGKIVFGSGENVRRAYLPAARNGAVELVELAFPGSSRPGLLGNRNELLLEWRALLGYATAASPSN